MVTAAAAGWWLGRWTFRRRSDPTVKGSTDAAFLRGVQLLLEDKPDKAIDTFIALMDVDDESIETHFALGGLFRRRGEVDRAIRIHQNLIARPTLLRAHREQALFALAEDYLSAGLLDRAESILVKLGDQSSRKADALWKLADLYERQKDWNQAISARRRLPSTEESERIIAHYFCELAEQHQARGDMTAVRKALKSSQAGGAWLVRGALMRFSIALLDGDLKTARRLLKRIAETDARLLLEVWPQLTEAVARTRGANPVDRFLGEIAARSANCEMAITQIALIHGDTDHATVRKGIRAWIEQDGTLREWLLRLETVEGIDALDDAVLARLADGLGALLRARANYLCNECGYRADRLYWQCPSCRSWDQTRPNLTSKFGLSA
ncbi:MAG: tetratricopeptide repeat protein [Pseudomonadota bacterium]